MSFDMIYNCKKKVLCPPKGLIRCNQSDDEKVKIPVDACLADEIKELWTKGIKTRGCCCGHGYELGFIEVTDDCVSKMEELGYVHYIYPKEFGGYKRFDAFVPKTYGHIYDGYVDSFQG